jgi:hypothetical protein
MTIVVMAIMNMSVAMITTMVMIIMLAFIFLFIVTPCHLDGIMLSVIATSDGNGWVDTRLSYP